MDVLLLQFLEGLASAAALFLVAAGLSLIFGVTRIVNFAHGSLYMLGAYLGWTLSGPLGFWLAVPAAALTVGGVGLFLEMSLLRRVYRSPELFQLLVTFAVSLMISDLTTLIWGREDLLGPRAPGLEGSIDLLGHPFPVYSLFLIVLGPLVLGALWLLLHRTRLGLLLRAAKEDRLMLGALGVNQARLFTAVFALGATLAGLGGALALPQLSLSPQLADHVVVSAFVVVVVGGLDSLVGAFLAAALIGEMTAFGELVWPQASLGVMFAVMAVVLLVRPQGLLGRPNLAPPPQVVGLSALTMSKQTAVWLVRLIPLLVLLPLFANDYVLSVATEIMILSLFASSLMFVTVLGGMTSFGHAAWFAIGAYTAALAQSRLGVIPALFAPPLVAAVIAFAFARLAVRLQGVHLAMLTLAFAEMIHAVTVAGGDEGLLGIHPPAWAQQAGTHYLVILLLCGAALALLWRLQMSPFGYALRAVRDNPARAEAMGISPLRIRWYAFSLSAGLAGAAGGMYVYLKGSVFPDIASLQTSVDALVMMLMGGMTHPVGAVTGAAMYTMMRLGLSAHVDLWKLVIGGIILVLAVPGQSHWWRRS